LNWIDDFGNQLNTANKLTDPEKKRIINSVVKDILVDYDQEEKLHHLRINFRLPVMSSVEGILRANDVVLKRGNNSTKMVQTIENTGAPERPRSALFHSNETGSMVHPFHGDKDNNFNQFYLTLSVDYYSATLWHPPYSDYQQFLFDTIDRMHQDGNSYIIIAKWFNDNGHLTPRGSVFKPNHAWSIHMKKRKSNARFARSYQPVITDMSVDITTQ
jgi:hypothetical protein